MRKPTFFSLLFVTLTAVLMVLLGTSRAHAKTTGSGGGKLQRVFLLTGETDGVAENTSRVGEMLKKYNVLVKVRIAPGMGHEIARDRMVTTYRRPLSWLALGH